MAQDQKWVSPDLIFSFTYHCVLGTASELWKPSQKVGLGQRGEPSGPFSEVQNYTVCRATGKTCGPVSGSEHIENINSHFLSYELTVSMWMGRGNKKGDHPISPSQVSRVHPFIFPPSSMSLAALRTLSLSFVKPAGKNGHLKLKSCV